MKNWTNHNQKNSMLDNDVAFQSKLQFMLNHEEDIAYVSRLRQMTENIEIEADANVLKQLEKQAGSSFSNKWLMGGLVIVALLASILFWSFNQSEIAVQQDLIIQKHLDYFVPPFNHAKNAPSSLKNGTIAYKAEDYSLAIEQLSIYVKNYPNDTDATLLLGISLTEIGDYTTAKINLQKVVDANDTFNIPSARKYLALCHLGQNQPLDAVGQLKKIEHDPFFKKEAQQLILEIQSKLMQ